MTFATATNIVTIDMIGTDDVTVDLSYLNNTGTSVVSGSLNSATSIVTLTKGDASTLTFDLSDVDNQNINTLTFDGSTLTIAIENGNTQTVSLAGLSASIWQEFATTTTTVDTTVSTLTTTVSKTIANARKVQISFTVPYKAISNTSGGLIVNTSVKINGNWYNLGNAGVIDDDLDIDSKSRRVYRGSYVIDAVANAGVATGADYTIEVELTAKASNGSLEVNPTDSINTSGMGSGSQVGWGTDQNFSNIIIKEL
jgi:hypothetical protein